MMWKDIPGYEGLYEISDTGIVKGKPRETKRKDGIKYYREAKIIKTYLSMGYKRLCLCKNGKQKQFLVHRLVALTFIKKEYGKDLVNHKDANKLNNNVNNLEWCTYKENTNHGTGNERRKETRKHSSKWKEFVVKNNKETSKPIIGINIDNGEVIEFSSVSEASRNGYNRSNIRKCANGKRSKHKGYKWFYKKDYIQGVGQC